MSKTKHRKSPMRLRSISASGQTSHKRSLAIQMKPAKRFSKSKVQSGESRRKSKKSRETVEPERLVSEESPKRDSSSDSKNEKTSTKISKKKTKSKESIWSAESEELSSEEDDRVPSKKEQRKSREAKKKKKRRKSKKDKKSKVESTDELGSQEPWSDKRFSDYVPRLYTSIHEPQEEIEERSPTPSVNGKVSFKEGSPSLHKVSSRGSLKEPSITSHKSIRSGSLKESSSSLHEVDRRKSDKKDEAKRAKENLEKKYRSMKIIFRDPRTERETIVIIDDEDDGQVPTGQPFSLHQQSPEQTVLNTQDQERVSGNAELNIHQHKHDKGYKNNKHVQHPSTNNKSMASETRSSRSKAEERSSRNHTSRTSENNGQTTRESGSVTSKYPNERTSKYSQQSNEEFKSSSISEDTIHKHENPTNAESLQPQVCKCKQNMAETGVNTVYNAHISQRFPPCINKIWHPCVTLANNGLYINSKHDQYKICNDGKLRLNNLKLLKGRNDVNSSECIFTCTKHAYNRNLPHMSDNHLILNEIYLKTINENMKREKKFIKNSKNKDEDTKLYEEISKSEKYKFDEHFENDKMLLPKQMTQLGTILPTKSSAMIDALDTVLQYSTTPDEFQPLPSGFLYYYSQPSTSSQITEQLGKYNKKCPKKSFWKNLFIKIFHNKQFKQKN